MKFATTAIHAGQPPDPSTGAIMTPIYQTSTYVQEAPGKHKGYDYARTANPTRTALEANLAALEGGKYCAAFSSGCAATNTVMNLLKSGDHVVSCRDLYGGSYRLFTKVYEKYGVSFSFVNAFNTDEIAKAMRPETKLLWIETPSNPQLTIVDIRACAEIARARRVASVIDNTFASPYLQQPLSLGVDIVVHSTTKYLGGHSDSVGGAVITNDKAIFDQVKFYQNSVGAVPGPMDCFLILRGTKTLAVRMERHCANARKIADYLAGHKEVAHVNYPGLKSHPGHEVAKKQMRDFGGMISLELTGGIERNVRFASSTKLISLAESLGGVESLIGHPISMTHGSIPPEERKKGGLPDALVRISVGIEDIEDLIEDVERAIDLSRNAR